MTDPPHEANRLAGWVRSPYAAAVPVQVCSLMLAARTPAKKGCKVHGETAGEPGGWLADSATV